MEALVTISKKEYDFLKSRSLMLNLLEGAGVDNWNGYEEAMDSYNSVMDIVEVYEEL